VAWPTDDACRTLRDTFLTMMCNPRRNVAFYVGNQAKRPHVLGVSYPVR
jgi:hypothetical protein